MSLSTVEQTHATLSPTVTERHRHRGRRSHRHLSPRPGSDATVETKGKHPTGTNGKQPVETNGKQPVETNGKRPAGTTRTLPADTNGHHLAAPNGPEPVKTPSVDPSCEDDRVDEPQWIGCWPGTDWTFPVGADNGQQPSTNRLETAEVGQMTANGEQPVERRQATTATQTSPERTFRRSKA
jgi:hypothetical protein